MDWEVDGRTATLRIDFDEGPSPSRDEVEGFLRQVAPVLGRQTVRRVSVNGDPVIRRRNVTVEDVALPVLYEAAQRRSLESRPTRWRTRDRRPAS
jgi:predicted pyridoxine 5'-phosphate oxidase superfamily flavin-nucleotide-binding protein